MTDLPFEERSDDLWGIPDFEGPAHDRPLPDWLSRSKSLLPRVVTGATPSCSSTRSWSSRPPGSTGR